MLAQLLVTASGTLLFLAAAFTLDLRVGLMALGAVTATVGLLLPERGKR